MAGSKENASAKEIRAYLREHYPEMIFISRKPTNHGAMIVHGQTGRIWLRGDKNYEILAQLTDPSFGTQMMNGMKRLFDVPATIDIRTSAENHAREIIGHFNELVELMGPPITLALDEDGAYLEAIRYSVIDFTISGRKER